MRPNLTLSVAGGTMHTLSLSRLHTLQSLVGEFGAETYPLFLRLGAVRLVELQPVTARALLAEVEKFLPFIQNRRVPGVSFKDAGGLEVGSIYGSVTHEIPVAATDKGQISITSRGIRVVLRQFPPPVGFRSAPTLENGWFECYFASLGHAESGAIGLRTPEMGGSGAPVRLDHLPPLPPATRWDYSRVSAGVAVKSVEFTETVAAEAYRDLLHAVTAACTECLRLRRTLRIERDRL